MKRGRRGPKKREGEWAVEGRKDFGGWAGSRLAG